jgi:hypothetical protein
MEKTLQLRIARLKPLGFHRLRVLDCLGGNDERVGRSFPPVGRYFVPAPDENIFDAFRAWVAQESKRGAETTAAFWILLLAAGRLLTGDLTAADVILSHLPAEPYKTDHGAGYCYLAPLEALRDALPLPAELRNTVRWVLRWLEGSPEQAAVRAWLVEHRDMLRWVEVDGLYVLPKVEARAGPT